jgi:hypothetical protein
MGGIQAGEFGFKLEDGCCRTEVCNGGSTIPKQARKTANCSSIVFVVWTSLGAGL